jgi:transcriptional regulator with XRE-family HTH domain
MSVSFGDLLKKFRLRAGFGLRKFAQMIDMAAPNLCDIEHGRRKPPAVEKLRDIAVALGLSEESEDWNRFFDAAGGEDLPPDVRHLGKRNLVPVLLRTISNQQLSDEQIEQLIDDMKARQGGSSGERQTANLQRPRSGETGE